MHPVVREVMLESMVIIGIVVLVALFIWAFFAVGMKRSELMSCYQLQSEAQQYPNTFYLVKWEKEMCDADKVEIHARVLGNDGQ